MEAEERLDQVFIQAFETNHPAMLDWVAIKFELKRLRAAKEERGEEIRDWTSTCPAFEKWWDENYQQWMPTKSSDEVKQAIYPAAKAAYIAAQEPQLTSGSTHDQPKS